MRKKLITLLLFVVLPSNLALLAFLGIKTRPAVAIISSVMTLGGLGFLYLVLKHGFVLGRGVTYSIENNPRTYYANVAFVFGWYLVVVAFTVGLYLQEIGYLSQK